MLLILRSTCLVVAAAIALCGCGSLRPADAPMRTLDRPAHCAAGLQPDTLLVLLPGSLSPPEEFEQEGFVRTVRQSGLVADLVLVDAHTGYYFGQTFVDRLRADVVAPARARGYRHVWLVGISIGGLGAMLYADARPDDVAGVVAIAPYLGTRLAAQDIVNAGGLARWRAPPFPVETDLDAGLWRWLQRQTRSAPAATPTTPIYLGYGLDDRFAYNAEVLGRALPPDRVFTTEGGHAWPAWKALWQRMVAQIPVERSSGCREDG